VVLARTPRSDWRTALPFALVIAGALGNLVDRLRFGYVVDFVDWYYGSYHWPAFNVADSAIVAGAVLLVLFSFKAPGPAPKGG
jgi:signal peptidase II